jgi:hypothetical protein
MFGKLALLLSCAGLVLLAALSISCGSSNSNIITPCTGGPYNVVGPWQITVIDNGIPGSLTLFGAIDSTGLALFFDNSSGATGDTSELPTLTGACSFSGNVTSYPEPNPIVTSPAVEATQGNVTSSTAINGTFTGTNGNPSGTYSMAPLSALTGPVTAVTGSMTGKVQGMINNQSLLLDLTFSQSGSDNSMAFTTVNLAGCEAAGTFTEQGTSNVFDVSISFQPGCPISGTFTGIGFESNTDYFTFHGGTPGTYLYADILAGSNTFVLEVHPLCAECAAARPPARNAGQRGLARPSGD